MKQWTPDNAKAAIMEKKQAAIVNAARTSFLEFGYTETSMDGIARTAKVGIKTVYRHFEDKDDLFIAVMQAACRPHDYPGGNAREDQIPSWFSRPPSIAIRIAGETYLRSVLDKDQIALFRVMTRDAHRFPELGRRYQREVIRTRNLKFVRYLEEWKRREHWKLENPERAANVFAALLRSELFEDALLGLRMPSEREIVDHAKEAATVILFMLNNARL